jgi:hypothetical protein
MSPPTRTHTHTHTHTRMHLVYQVRHRCRECQRPRPAGHPQAEHDDSRALRVLCHPVQRCRGGDHSMAWHSAACASGQVAAGRCGAGWAGCCWAGWHLLTCPMRLERGQEVCGCSSRVDRLDCRWHAGRMAGKPAVFAALAFPFPRLKTHYCCITDACAVLSTPR